MSKPVFGRGGRRKRRRHRVVPPEGAWGFWPRPRPGDFEAAVVAALVHAIALDFEVHFGHG